MGAVISSVGGGVLVEPVTTFLIRSPVEQKTQTARGEALSSKTRFPCVRARCNYWKVLTVSVHTGSQLFIKKKFKKRAMTPL